MAEILPISLLYYFGSVVACALLCQMSERTLCSLRYDGVLSNVASVRYRSVTAVSIVSMQHATSNTKIKTLRHSCATEKQSGNFFYAVLGFSNKVTSREAFYHINNCIPGII